jgi:chromosome partitioning protein
LLIDVKRQVTQRIKSGLMNIIAIANQKAGVGKTTSAIHIGAGLHQLGKRVLLIDLNPQANLTHSLGIMANGLDKTVYHVLKGEVPIEAIWIDRTGMKVLPSTPALAGAEMELSGMPGREFLLKEGIGRPWGFDYILIDCPPSLGLLTLNALTTAKEILIPVGMEILALQGMRELLQTVEVVKKWLNRVLTVAGVIQTRLDARKTFDREVEEKIKAYFGDKVYKTQIREDISLAKASSFGKTVFEYNSDSPGAKNYSALCTEIIERGSKRASSSGAPMTMKRVHLIAG